MTRYELHSWYPFHHWQIDGSFPTEAEAVEEAKRLGKRGVPHRVVKIERQIVFQTREP